MSDASALAKSDRFKRLLKTLNQSELEMTSYELADLCWLLLHSPQIVESTEIDTPVALMRGILGSLTQVVLTGIATNQNRA
jgi:hypothetical protein